MSKFYKILIIFFFSTISVNANTQSSVAYLDLDFILSNSISGKKMFEKLKKQEDKKVAELKLKEENLKTEENKILSSKNIISRLMLYDLFDCAFNQPCLIFFQVCTLKFRVKIKSLCSLFNMYVFVRSTVFDMIFKFVFRIFE